MNAMKRILYIAATMLAVSCGSKTEYEAQGTFEATEVVVSSEATGRILDFGAEEGTQVTEGATVGTIDSLQLHLQRKQLAAQLSALLGSRPDIKAQAASLREQIAKQQTERTRVRNMLRDGAATQKQLDDIEAQIRVLEASFRQRFRHSARIRQPSMTMRRRWRCKLPRSTTVSPSAASRRP